jgi:hypothetical protein
MYDNNTMKRCFLLLALVPVFVFSEAMYSPTWGFFIDLPEGYEYIDGNGRDRFSFSGPVGAMFDLVVYNNAYGTINQLVNDINKRIGNSGEVDYFNYNDKQAAIIELKFGNYRGWGLCFELPASPMLLALAYGPADMDELDIFHISALDSICPSIEDRFYPGAVIEYSYPRGEMKPITLKGGVNSLIRENDEEAAQVLIEREFSILTAYADTDYWQTAWLRYYRFIYRDSWDRIINPVYALALSWGGLSANNTEAKKVFAQKSLDFVQGFKYERDFTGSDFLNLVTALTQGRGDCDSRSMLWAMFLACADIRSAMMVSRQYSHAMGLAEIDGNGARFEAFGTKWLVAETTDNVDIGLIAQDQSDPQYWIGIIFE